PKFGILITPWKNTHLRAAYTRSLGGVFFDTSLRLEPTQIGGFNQAFRSLIPESVIGLVPATRFETWGVGLDHAFPEWGTYLVAEAELLRSKATRNFGLLANADTNVFILGPDHPLPDTISSASESLRFREKSLLLAFNQLIGPLGPWTGDFAVGARYRL